jgi:type I restriction enzyme S subunit
MGQSPDSTDVTPFQEDGDLPFLQGNAEFGDVFPTPKHACGNPPKKAHKGDILLSVRAPVGAMNLADRECGIGRGLCSITSNNIGTAYLWWSLHHYRCDLFRVATGSTYEAVSAEEVRDLNLLVPPFEEQESIASFLNHETKRIDELIHEKEQMLELLAEKRAALVTQAVTRGLDSKVRLKPSGIDWLGEIPAHWELVRLKFLATIRTGLTIGKDYGAKELSEYYYLRVANVQDGYLDLSDVTKVLVSESEAAGCLLKMGDVLMNEGGDIDKLGRGCVWKAEIEPCLHQNHVFAVRPHSVDSEWLAMWTSTLPAKSYFEQRAKRTTNLASISSTNIKEISVPLPPPGEQKAILDFIAEATAHFDDVKATTLRSIDLLRERRSAVITTAVTGQLALEEMTP